MRALFVALLCLPLYIQAQTNQDSITIKKMVDEVMTNGKAYDLLRELTKNIGGRLAGSPQQQNAAIWGKRNLASFNPDKVFLQACKTPNWQRGGKDFAAIVGIGGVATNQPLAALALGNTEWSMQDSEMESRRLRRSLYVVKDVSAGDTVTPENVRAIRPGGGCPPKVLDYLLGKRFTKSHVAGTPMTPELIAE